MTQTSLFSRKQPGGMYVIADIEKHAGNVWFVDSGHASAVNSVGAGQNPDVPFATLDYAIGQCTASNGDVIYVMPGHTESITAAAGIAADVAGISIIGLGNGNNRPVITIASTDNAGTMTVSADNIKIANLVIVCNDDALTNALVVTGDNCDIDIEFQDTSSTVEAATAVRLDTANNCNLKLKYLGFTGGNAVVSAVRLDDCDNVTIDIDAYGVVSTAWVEMVDVASTNVTVRGRMYTQGITNFTRDVVDTITGSTWDAVIFDASAGSVISGGSAAALATDDVTALATAIAVIDEFHDVPAANNVLNAQINEVIGNKTDTAASGAVTSTDTLVAYIKQLVTELAVVDELHDVPAADNALNAQMNEVIGNKTDAVAAGDVTSTDTLVAYIKQIVSELSGTTGIATWPAAAAPANAVSIAEALRYISENQVARYAAHVKADVTAGTAWTTGNSPVTLFTVTGDVLARCFASVQTSLTSTGTNGTLELGVAGLTAGLLVQDVVDGSAFQTGDAWTLITAADTPGAQLADEWLFIAGGADIILTVATNSMTAGAITVYCEYIPISSGASVVTT